MYRLLKIFIIIGQILSFAVAQVVLIPNVPDHSQPPDVTLPSTQNNSSNYCAPFAFVNIVDYWETVYLHHNAQGMMGGLPAKQIAEFIGWFMDTNDQGSPNRRNGTDSRTYPAAEGTYAGDQSTGMQEFVTCDTANMYGFPYTLSPAKQAYPWQISPPLPESFAAGYQAEIGMGRPVKLDFIYWNPIPTGDSIFVPISGSESEIVHIYTWGPQIGHTDQPGWQDVPWERWNLEREPLDHNIGHAVTGVGYIIDTLEFAIVHDNWSATPKNIAIPWRDNQGMPMVTAMISVTLPPAIVKMSLPDTAAFTGEQLLIPVKAGDLTGLHVYSYFMNIAYDPLILQAQGTTTLNSLSTSWGTPTVDLTTPGELIVSHSGSPELSGTGDLVYLQFGVIGSVGDSAQLQLKTTAFNFGDPVADTLSGSVKIIPRAVNVTIASNPEGLQIEVDGTSYTAPKIFNWQEGEQHQLSPPSPQAGSEGTRYIFDAWSNNESMQQMITIPAVDTIFTADYHTEYEFAIGINPETGGTVTVSPDQSWILADSQVVIRAIANSGFEFSQWHGDHSGSKNPDTLIMDQPKEIIAYFSDLTSAAGNDGSSIPKTYALQQCFPNPFNPATMINYQLPMPGEVELSVYTMLGQKVAILVKTYMPAGYHQVALDAQHLASGIYIYKLQAGTFTAVKKMILAK
jgi:hypothetical protein